MDQEKTVFEIITFKSAVKKGVPYQKKSIQKFTSAESFEKVLKSTLKKQLKKFEVIDKEKKTKTLYYKSLGAYNYQKKECII